MWNSTISWLLPPNDMWMQKDQNLDITPPAYHKINNLLFSFPYICAADIPIKSKPEDWLCNGRCWIAVGGCSMWCKNRQFSLVEHCWIWTDLRLEKCFLHSPLFLLSLYACWVYNAKETEKLLWVFNVSKCSTKSSVPLVRGKSLVIFNGWLIPQVFVK